MGASAERGEGETDMQASPRARVGRGAAVWRRSGTDGTACPVAPAAAAWVSWAVSPCCAGTHACPAA